jgi:transcriptional regulator with XRE-family HTH domain
MLRLVKKEGGEVGMTLGERLRAAREKLGLDLEDIADQLGYSESHLSYCERGRRGMSMELLNAWCDLLGLRFKQMVLLKEKEQEAKADRKRARKTELRVRLAGKQAVTDAGEKAGT